MNDRQKMAELLFGHIDKTPADWLAHYPPRELPEGAMVTRFAPSPTGYLHIGGLFSALASERSARLTGGRFLLRIEDTDKKREVTDGVTGILEGLADFGLTADEGVTGRDTERGAYGPYTQSLRKEIYQSFAKQLVAEGKAYPCFLTEEELSEIRARQEKEKKLPGCYGEYARYREVTCEQAEALIREGREYVIRLHSPGREDGRFSFVDGIKGRIEMPENITDVVVLKSDGLPTYHFAHVVDDTLMRVTHVIRGDEWIASVPIHVQLFDAVGQPRPNYAHIAPILKDDEGGRRKISKRRDPEAAVSYFTEEGYPAEAVVEYLLGLLNSNFEDWRRQNPLAPASEFPFTLKKMSASGALFDMVKLSDVSKTVIVGMSAEEVARRASEWAKVYDPALYERLSRDEKQTCAIFSIDRGGAKPRRDLGKWSDVAEYTSYFFEDSFEGFSPLPENISKEDAAAILAAYKKVYDPEADKDAWFAGVKAMCPALGFAPEVKLYKKNPGEYKGHVGDVSTVLRLAATGRRQTPDLCAILRLLGRERFFARADKYVSFLEGKK